MDEVQLSTKVDNVNNGVEHCLSKDGTSNESGSDHSEVKEMNDSKSGWVKFDDETNSSDEPISPQPSAHSATPSSRSVIIAPAVSTIPAVLNTETVQVNLDRSADNGLPDTRLPTKNVEFVTVRQGFTNGDVVVTLLPVNTKWPWITAAQFRPELVPEELMAQGLTLTVEDYVHAMELLVNDVRFTLYNICYKRVLVCWITLAFTVLLALLFSGLTGLALFCLGVLWLLLNAASIFLCMWMKLRLARGLELCLARVNKLLTRHKLVLALDDRGRISCHKVNLCFLYFDAGPCIAQLQQFIDREEGAAIQPGWEQRLDVTSHDIVIQGSQTTRLSRKQMPILKELLAKIIHNGYVPTLLLLIRGYGKMCELDYKGAAEQAYVRYLQRWGKDFLRRRLDWTLDEEGGNPSCPRHLAHALCPCQYIEEVLRNKPVKDKRACFPLCNNWMRKRGVD